MLGRGKQLSVADFTVAVVSRVATNCFFRTYVC